MGIREYLINGNMKAVVRILLGAVCLWVVSTGMKKDIIRISIIVLGVVSAILGGYYFYYIIKRKISILIIKKKKKLKKKKAKKSPAKRKRKELTSNDEKIKKQMCEVIKKWRREKFFNVLLFSGLCYWVYLENFGSNVGKMVFVIISVYLGDNLAAFLSAFMVRNIRKGLFMDGITDFDTKKKLLAEGRSRLQGERIVGLAVLVVITLLLNISLIYKV